MDEDSIVIHGRLEMEFSYAAGKTGSAFFRALKDKKEILGRKCPECERILLPPRSFCERCFTETTEWVGVGCGGTVQAFTVVYEKFEGLPEPPYAIAYVLLDGASTSMANFVKGIDLSDTEKALRHIKIGRRVRVVFKRKREGRITDFWYEPEEL